MYQSLATIVLGLLCLESHAYPWALDIANGKDQSGEAIAAAIARRQSGGGSCPVHLSRKGAAPYSDIYPGQYTGAKNGLAGTGKGGVLVPAANDTAHAYEAPASDDVRGPW